MDAVIAITIDGRRRLIVVDKNKFKPKAYRRYWGMISKFLKR